MELLQYNTSRKFFGLKEYGRHIQKMVDYLLTIEDRDKRNQQTQSVIELMGVLNPHLKNVEDFRHMLWDHLFAMSDFTLDVDSPYPIPQKETYKQKTDPMKYPRRYPKYAHLGKNLEMIMDRALAEPDQERKLEFANSIAYYMKLTYSNWHHELVHDDAIRNELNQLTNGKLEFSSTPNIRHNKQAASERDDFNRSSSPNISIGMTASGSGNGGGTRKNFGSGGRSNDSKNTSSGRSSSNGGRSEGRSSSSRDGNGSKGGSSSNNRGGSTSSSRSGGGSSSSGAPSRNFKKRF